MPRLSSSLFVLLLWSAAIAPAAVPAGAAPGPLRSNRPSSAVQGAQPPLAVAPAPLAVRVDPRQALGSPTAALALVEFADYQCPYCRSFHLGTLNKLQAAYIDTGKLRYFYKDFPLPTHRHALGAAIAAYCAGEQGRYWRMQQRLYEEQARLGGALYDELGVELELDRERFHTCRRSAPARQAVSRDLNDGRRLGVRGTPTFALGRIEGDRVVVERIATGAPAFEEFAREIEALARPGPQPLN